MRHTPFYRILVILFCYAMIALFVFIPLAQDPNKNPMVLIIVGGVFILAFLLTVVIEEIGHAKRKKRKKEEEADE
ncbi:MAG: hypothetical protein SPG64_04000 [Candidatus Enteromonas sp.]|nr:hypothetical protein [Candidatus Enteromonas sp.]